MKFVYPSDRWENAKPETLGMSSSLIQNAATQAQARESRIAHDFSGHGEKWGEIIGPMPKERGAPNGLVIRNGYVVSEWGDTDRVDLTFSVTKSFVSAVAGLAFDRGLIRDVHDPVKDYVDTGEFNSPQNTQITWHHLLQQTSEWAGTLFGKHWTADSRERKSDNQLEGTGAYWEYNDVRVNLLSLCLLRVWEKPLPEVLKDEVMDPIGASDTWQWHGYHNSDVEVNGKMMKSVSGGGHWGGGLWMSTRDLARFGYLFLRRGKWKDRQIISDRWVEMSTTPCEIKPGYGYLWWLNTDHERWPNAPESSFAALGYGSNILWIDPEHDMVVVIRWHADELSGDVQDELIDTLHGQDKIFALVTEAIRS
jgi:CubicO group peptidase (beta-lactamase class C family)